MPLAFLVLAAACAAEPPGRALFDANGCRACHRVGDAGGDAGPDLSWVGFRRGREWLDLWLSGPQHWKPDTLMPDPRLKDAERAALVDYLASLRQAPRVPETADPVERGRRLYVKAGCVACHGPQGRGGHPNNNVQGGEIPALGNAGQTFTLEELEKKIRSGSRPAKADPAGPEPLVRMPAWGEVLDDGQIEAVARYLMTMGAGRPQEF